MRHKRCSSTESHEAHVDTVYAGVNEPEKVLCTGYGPVDALMSHLVEAVEERMRRQLADRLRAFTNAIEMAGHRVFDIDVLAEMIEKGEL